MTNGKNIILNILTFIVIATLAASTIYFFLQSQDNKITPKPAVSDQSKEETKKQPKTSADQEPKTTKESSISSITQPGKTGKLPSNPAETYVLQSGETLSTLAAKLNINWTRVIEVNNIENPDSVKIGQQLIIPSYNDKNKKLYVSFLVDLPKATQIQEEASKNTSSLYLDPIKTAKNDSSGIYGIAENDNFSLSTTDEYEGTAVITVAHQDKQYQINLSQPVKKGKGGIWAISQIQPL